MSHLMREALHAWPHGTMSGVAALLFMGVFLGAIGVAYGPGSSKRAERDQSLPFEDNETVERTSPK